MSVMLGLLLELAGSERGSAGNVMNYGADGNDYYRFTTPTMAFDKASGFTTLIAFTMHVNPDGTLLIGGDVACTNGVYTGSTNWNSLITILKTAPTTVTRYEVCIGGWQDSSYDNIKSLINSHGSGPGSILYKNFQALKTSVPGIDAINDDDEQTYDLNSSVSLADMLGGLGYKFTMVPYTAQSFWVNLRHSVTNCDYIYLQCYEGGAGNDPGQWDSAFGNGVVVIPGQESNTANPATFHNWYMDTGVQGGFYYPDVVFDSTFWSAAIIESYGVVPAQPVAAIRGTGGEQVSLSWNTVPGAVSYNVRRATSSGGESFLANVSTANNNWPESNQYTDAGLAGGTNYFYEVSAVNTNGESPNSAEISAAPQPGAVNNSSFEFDAAGGAGQLLSTVPTGWSAFNEAGSSDIGSQNAGGTDYSIYDPLASPAEGNQYCYVNMFNSAVTGGIYQDVGSLQPNTRYTLTVAIGSRKDRINSPGIISLVNGVNNTGTVLVRGGGLPATRNTWRDYSTNYTTGPDVTGDLTIVLSVVGNGTTIQADFDNVQLVALKAPTLEARWIAGSSLVLTGGGGIPNGGYTLLTTTNLSAPILWTTNTTGTLDSTGAFSNAVPISTTSFFRIRMP